MVAEKADKHYRTITSFFDSDPKHLQVCQRELKDYEEIVDAKSLRTDIYLINQRLEKLITAARPLIERLKAITEKHLSLDTMVLPQQRDSSGQKGNRNELLHGTVALKKTEKASIHAYDPKETFKNLQGTEESLELCFGMIQTLPTSPLGRMIESIDFANVPKSLMRERDRIYFFDAILLQKIVEVRRRIDTLESREAEMIVKTVPQLNFHFRILALAYEDRYRAFSKIVRAAKAMGK